jgi:translocation and assembly module TamB
MSVLGAAAAGGLKSILSNKLPLDMLSIDTGEKGFSQLRVEGGTYLSDRAYLGASVQLGANPEKGENTATGTFEYQLTKRWTLEAAYGDAQSGGLEVIWSREY